MFQSFQCKNLTTLIKYTRFQFFGCYYSFLASNCILHNQFLYIHLYPTTLLKAQVTSSSSVFINSTGFSTKIINSPVNNDNFTSFFLTWMPFISLSCLTEPARTSKKTPCLVPYIRRKVLSLSPLNMMQRIIFFTNILNLVEKVPFYSNFTGKVSNRSGCCGSIYTTICKTDSQWKFAVPLRELKPGLCNNLEGWERVGGGREAPDEGDISTPIHVDVWQKSKISFLSTIDLPSQK